MAVDWLTPEDTRLLDLESEVIAGHTCKLIEATGPAPSLETLRAHVAARLERASRLRCRLEPSGPAGRPAWVDDDAFDIAEHVLAIDRPLDRTALRESLASLMSTRLDRSRALWSLHAASLEGGRAAFVLRLHHALADGSAAMRIASSVLWDEQDAPPSRTRPTRVAATRRHRRREDARILLRELAPLSRRSIFAAPISRARRVAFASAPLGDIERIARALDGSTVNDVILSAVAGGLRRGLPAGTPLRRLRMKIPVNVRRPDDPPDAANRDSFMCVDADLGEKNSLMRLHAVSEQTRQRKLAHDGEVLDHVMHGRPTVGRVLDRWAHSPRVFALNVSNVRGPSGSLSVLGAPVTSVYSVAEVARRHALRVACLSAAGRMTFGLCADASAVEGVDAIAAGIEAELTDLLDTLGG